MNATQIITDLNKTWETSLNIYYDQIASEHVKVFSETYNIPIENVQEKVAQIKSNILQSLFQPAAGSAAKQKQATIASDTMSRKELQALCKEYNIPTRRKNMDMVNALNNLTTDEVVFEKPKQTDEVVDEKPKQTDENVAKPKHTDNVTKKPTIKKPKTIGETTTSNIVDEHEPQKANVQEPINDLDSVPEVMQILDEDKESIDDYTEHQKPRWADFSDDDNLEQEDFSDTDVL